MKHSLKDIVGAIVHAMSGRKEDYNDVGRMKKIKEASSDKMEDALTSEDTDEAMGRESPTAGTVEAVKAAKAAAEEAGENVYDKRDQQKYLRKTRYK